MNIAYVSSSTLPGARANGVQVMRMCEAMAELGHDVTLYAGHGEGGRDPFEYYGVSPSFRLVRLPLRSGVGQLAYSVAVARRLRRRRPDLVYGRHVPTLLLAARLGLPTAVEVHALPTTPDTSLVRRLVKNRVESLLLRQEHLVETVFISEALRRDYRILFPVADYSRSVVAPDGAVAHESSVVSLDGWPGRAGAVQVGYVGALYRGRGVEIIVEASRRLPDLDFHIVGGGADDVRALTERPLPVNLYVHGHLPHSVVSAVTRRIDIGLAPYQHRVAVAGNAGDTSRWMSPLKIFEYMSAECAVVASDLPVLHEVLDDGRNALLVPAADVGAWVDAIRRLADDNELRRSMVMRARADLTGRFSWDVRARRVLAPLGR